MKTALLHDEGAVFYFYDLHGWKNKGQRDARAIS
jgi:hypothetical protein